MGNWESQNHCSGFLLEPLSVSPQQWSFQSLGFQCKRINSKRRVIIEGFVFQWETAFVCLCTLPKSVKDQHKGPKISKHKQNQILRGRFLWDDHVSSFVSYLRWWMLFISDIGTLKWLGADLTIYQYCCVSVWQFLHCNSETKEEKHQ